MLAAQAREELAYVEFKTKPAKNKPMALRVRTTCERQSSAACNLQPVVVDSSLRCAHAHCAWV